MPFFRRDKSPHDDSVSKDFKEVRQDIRDAERQMQAACDQMCKAMEKALKEGVNVSQPHVYYSLDPDTGVVSARMERIILSVEV